MIGARQLAAMKEDAWVVNVARGSLVDTDAPVEALAADAIGRAALDVTDPEPLPDGHPLCAEPRAVITLHTANPPDALARALAKRVAKRTWPDSRRAGSSSESSTSKRATDCHLPR
jgi:phosphoglycerate dehydrogenase-like enzyme